MKVIFLDIDGVLATKNFLLELLKSDQPISDARGHHLFDPVCIFRLKTIIDNTGAVIVISSAWRTFGEDEIRRIWQERNMPGKLFGLTPRVRDVRGAEIDAWLDAQFGNVDPVESFVIIDDDVFDLLIGQTSRIVRTDKSSGLSNSDVEMAIRILNTPIKFDVEQI